MRLSAYPRYGCGRSGTVQADFPPCFEGTTMNTTDTTKKDLVKELEALEVIESTEIKVGNAFHAFRFKMIVAPVEG